MQWADVITDQPGAYMGSQAGKSCDVARLFAKRKLKVKCNTSMHQEISYKKFGDYPPKNIIYSRGGMTLWALVQCLGAHQIRRPTSLTRPV